MSFYVGPSDVRRKTRVHDRSGCRVRTECGKRTEFHVSKKVVSRVPYLGVLRDTIKSRMSLLRIRKTEKGEPATFVFRYYFGRKNRLQGQSRGPQSVLTLLPMLFPRTGSSFGRVEILVPHRNRLGHNLDVLQEGCYRG